MHSALPFAVGKGARHDWCPLRSAQGKGPSEIAPITQNNLIAYFPQALLTGSKFLSSSYHDVPLDEPELIQDLLLAELGFLHNEKRQARRGLA